MGASVRPQGPRCGRRWIVLLPINRNIFLSLHFKRQFAAVVETMDSEARMLVFKFRFLSLPPVILDKMLYLFV